MGRRVMDLTLKGVLPMESTSESTSDAVGLGGQLSHGIDRYVRAGVTTAHKKGLVSEYFTSDHAERRPGNRHFVQTEEFGNPLSRPCAGKLSEQGRV